MAGASDRDDLPDFSDLMPRRVNGPGDGRRRTADWSELAALPPTNQSTAEWRDLGPNGGPADGINRTADWTELPGVTDTLREATADWSDIDGVTQTLPYVREGLDRTADWTDVPAGQGTMQYGQRAGGTADWSELLDD